jgi:hypothetical protein
VIKGNSGRTRTLALGLEALEILKKKVSYFSTNHSNWRDKQGDVMIYE